MAMGGNTSNDFVFGIVILAVAILFLLPTFIAVFVDKTDSGEAAPEYMDEVLSGYNRFTGSYPTNEEVWAITGIYTPVGVDANGDPTSNYAYTPDHWIFGARKVAYAPSQFTGASSYQVNYDNGFYFYNGNTLDGHKAGDLYTSVAMDVNQKSDIFFTPSGKRMSGENWYYEYNGLRYAFQPLSDYMYKDSNGDLRKTTSSNTSLSLIWYSFYDEGVSQGGGDRSGISGQLVLSGSDSGVAYLTANTIVAAFNSANNMAKFEMEFNGNLMNVYIKIKNEYTSLGYSVAECFDYGYWEIMVSSISTNVNTYLSTDYSLNVYSIWDTFVDLFTFHMDDYNMSPEMGMVASLTISVVMYAALLAIGVTSLPVLIIAGLVALIQTIATAGFEIPDLWPFW